MLALNLEGTGWPIALNYLPSCETFFLIARKCHPRSLSTKKNTLLIFRLVQDTKVPSGKSQINSAVLAPLSSPFLRTISIGPILKRPSALPKLERYEEFARLMDAGTVTLDVPGHPGRTFIGFVEEWIDGDTLEIFLKKSGQDVSSSLMVSYVNALSSALFALQANGLKHDDLHSGNVMIAKPALGEIDGDFKIKLIDMGSLKPADAPTNKPKDDHRHFVDHLVAIRNAIHAKRSMPIRERRFLSEADKLIDSMIEEDASVRLRDPSQIKQQFQLAITRANALRTTSSSQLASPLRIPFR